MHIAYVLNTYPQPSHSFIRREVRALERQGFAVTRLAMRRADVPLVDDMDREEAAVTQYVLEAGPHRLLWSMLHVGLRGPAAMARALRLALRAGRRSEVGRLRHLIYLAEAAHVTRLCHRGGVAHVHAHFGTNAAAVAMLAHEMGGPGYSFTVHGPEEFDAPRALSLGDKITRARFAVGISSFGRSQLCRWVDQEHWPRIRVVHCGIEAARFASPAPLPERGLELVAIGRFVEQKGQMVLIPALERLRETHPEVHLKLIGDGPLRTTLERAVRAARLDRNVSFTGWLDEDAIRAALDQAHALVMPSFAEGLPMVVMEAMAAARPVIATLIAGTPELVQDGITGWLVPAGDADALAGALAALADTSPDARREMGLRGRARVLARHDVDTEAARLGALFHAAAKQGALP